MEARPSRNLTDRDLRALSTDDLLAVIQADIRELDALIMARRPPKPPKKTAREALEAAAPDEAPESLPLHTVTCCGSHMGDFPAYARIRCPFCGGWHRAGDFPRLA